MLSKLNKIPLYHCFKATVFNRVHNLQVHILPLACIRNVKIVVR